MISSLEAQLGISATERHPANDYRGRQWPNQSWASRQFVLGADVGNILFFQTTFVLFALKQFCWVDFSSSDENLQFSMESKASIWRGQFCWTSRQLQMEEFPTERNITKLREFLHALLVMIPTVKGFCGLSVKFQWFPGFQQNCSHVSTDKDTARQSSQEMGGLSGR